MSYCPDYCLVCGLLDLRKNTKYQRIPQLIPRRPSFSRCVAVNNFVPKSQRVFKPQVNVVPQQNMAAVQRMAGRLMGPFQDTHIRLRERSALHLLCAAYHGLGHSDLAATEVRWSFTPRASVIPIELEGARNELKFSQVLHVQHDGVYNCSTRSDYQVSKWDEEM